MSTIPSHYAAAPSGSPSSKSSKLEAQKAVQQQWPLAGTYVLHPVLNYSASVRGADDRACKPPADAAVECEHVAQGNAVSDNTTVAGNRSAVALDVPLFDAPAAVAAVVQHDLLVVGIEISGAVQPGYKHGCGRCVGGRD